MFVFILLLKIPKSRQEKYGGFFCSAIQILGEKFTTYLVQLFLDIVFQKYCISKTFKIQFGFFKLYRVIVVKIIHLWLIIKLGCKESIRFPGFIAEKKSFVFLTKCWSFSGEFPANIPYKKNIFFSLFFSLISIPIIP